jgi:hypothetical protein
MTAPAGDGGLDDHGLGRRPSSAARPLSRRRLLGGAAAAGMGAAAGVLGGWAAAPGAASAAQVTGASGRPVPVGDGREIWLESSGSGAPVVVLVESGYHDGASIWSQEDLLSPAAGPAVFPGLAATSQVIATTFSTQGSGPDGNPVARIPAAALLPGHPSGHQGRLGGDRRRHERGPACRGPAAASRDAAAPRARPGHRRHQAGDRTHPLRYSAIERTLSRA